MKTLVITILNLLFATSFAKPVVQTTKVWYYYNEEGVSTCSEPYEDLACTSELHIVGTKYYYPYSIWYTFEKANNTLDYTLWFKFNNTNAVQLDKVACDNEFHDTPIDKKYFGKLNPNFDVNFHHTCNYDTKTNTISDFYIYQETHVDKKLQSNFTLAFFLNWELEEYPPIDFDNLQYPIMDMKTSAPKDDECIYCK